MPGPLEPTLRVLEVFVGQWEGVERNECGHIRGAAGEAMLHDHWVCTVTTGNNMCDKESGREVDFEEEFECE